MGNPKSAFAADCHSDHNDDIRVFVATSHPHVVLRTDAVTAKPIVMDCLQSRPHSEYSDLNGGNLVAISPFSDITGYNRS